MIITSEPIKVNVTHEPIKMIVTNEPIKMIVTYNVLPKRTKHVTYNTSHIKKHLTKAFNSPSFIKSLKPNISLDDE